MRSVSFASEGGDYAGHGASAISRSFVTALKKNILVILTTSIIVCGFLALKKKLIVCTFFLLPACMNAHPHVHIRIHAGPFFGVYLVA